MLDKMEPQLIRFKTRLKSNFARVTFAQSITLTPGTITVSLQDDEMTVYALTRSAAESLPGEMERRIARALEPENV
jgi:multicomponent Na+:H+ antiporter subunit E